MKVCWLTSVAAPYTIRLFEEISKSVDLCVVMDDKKEENRNSEWVLNDSDSYKTYRIGKDYSNKIKQLSCEYDILVDGLYLSRYGYLAVKEFKKQGKKVIMAADGGIPKNRGFIINGIMSFLMKRHSYFLSSSQITDRYFTYYGVDPERIYHYRFTSLDSKNICENKELSRKKEELRKKLAIEDRFTMISVGQPIPRKGFDILIKSYIESDLCDEINLNIIGGKPQPEVKKIVNENNLKNVHFIDLLTTKELNQYYAASDLFILCTREDIWGLVIEEAMSFGLPVITSDNCVAGLHFELIDKNVKICGVTDVKAYSERIKEFYESKGDSSEIRKSILDSVAPYTIENSAQDIIKVLSLL